MTVDEFVAMMEEDVKTDLLGGLIQRSKEYKQMKDQLQSYTDQLDLMINKPNDAYSKDVFDDDIKILTQLTNQLIQTALGYGEGDRNSVKRTAALKLSASLIKDNTPTNKQLEVKLKNFDLLRKHSETVNFINTHEPLRDTDIDTTQPGSVLGAGAQGEVRSVFIRTPDGTVIEAGRKFDNEKASAQGYAIRIPDNNPEEAKRAAAVYEASRFIGLDIVPPTFIFFGRNPKTDKDEIGQVMKRIPGSDGQKKVSTGELIEGARRQRLLELRERFNENPTSLAGAEKVELEASIFEEVDGETRVFKAQNLPVDIDYTLPVIQKELADLHLLDIFVGHADRHAGNWRYEMDATNHIIGVRAIDNDDTWGKAWQPKPAGGWSGTNTPGGAPPIVDVHSAISILKADIHNVPDGIRNKLTDEEVGLAFERLENLQNQIKDRIANGKMARMPDTDVSEEDQNFLKQQARLADNYSFQNILQWGFETTFIPMVQKEGGETTSYLGQQWALRAERGAVPL